MVVDWTFLNAYQQCPQKGRWRMGLGLVPLEANLALEFGKCLHTALDVLHSTLSFEEALGKFSLVYGKFEGLDPKRNIQNAAKLLFSYFEQMKVDPWEDLEGEKVGELGFAVDIAEHITYKGIIDRPGKYNGELAIKEFKTSSWPTSFISNPNGQITGYHFGASSLLGDVQMIIVDIFGVFAPLKSGKESVRQLLFRHQQTRTKEDWSRFRDDVLGTVDAINRWEALNYWPRHTDFCSSYGGCAYIPLCMDGLNEHQRQILISQSYRVEVWIPGEREKEV